MISTQQNYLIKLNGEYVREAFDSRTRSIRPLRVPVQAMHFYYPIESIFDEVNRRTSLIGRHRKTQDGSATLLDSIALTDDERETFDVLCRKAAIDVFDKLIAYSSRHYQSFFYNEGSNSTICVSPIDNSLITAEFSIRLSENSNRAFVTDYTLTTEKPLGENEQLSIRIPFGYTVSNCIGEPEARQGEWVLTTDKLNCEPTTHAKIVINSIDFPHTQRAKQQRLHARLQTALDIDGETATSIIQGEFPMVLDTETYTDMQLCDCEQAFVDFAEFVSYDYTPATYDFATDFEMAIDETPSEHYGISPEYLLSLTIDDQTHETEQGEFVISLTPECEFSHINPREVVAGSFVENTDKNGDITLYFALKDSDEDSDLSGKERFLAMKDDWRKSVHYLLLRPEYERNNANIQVDQSIFEALVCHIIASWFEVVNGEGYELYASKYSNAMIKIKERLNNVGDFQVISHPF